MTANKMQVFFLLAFCLAAVRALPEKKERTSGGSVADRLHRYAASMLFSENLISYEQKCVGTIITTSAVLSAARCYHGHELIRWRARVGSALANSGGTVHTLRAITPYPDYNGWSFDNDIAVLRTTSNILLNDHVDTVPIAGPNYNPVDDQTVWAAGWSKTSVNGDSSEELRYSQLVIVNQRVCYRLYNDLAFTVTDNMLCAGWLGLGTQDRCDGDDGGPVLHNDVLVGISSWSQTCALSRYPRVSTRVSRYTAWIQETAA